MKQKRVIILSFLSLLAVASLSAQTEGKEHTTKNEWYVGISADSPFGISTFSSFGKDKTRFGYGGGIFVGHRFNKLFSLELSASLSQIGMSACKCCTSYWLGADWNRYFAPVAGMNGWEYSNLYNKVLVQQYGLHFNIDALALLNGKRESRWSILLSPSVYAVGTKATLKTIDANVELRKGDQIWHLGMGGNLTAEYRVAKHLSLGLYTGLNYLLGKDMDEMPIHGHTTNFIWQSGLRIGFSFGGSAKVRKQVPADVQVEQPIQSVQTEPVDTAVAVEQQPVEQPVVVEQPKEITPEQVEEKSLSTVYFAFNSYQLRNSELLAMKNLLKKMKEDPSLKITVNGWCDSKGSVTVNKRISRLRAQAVKDWLVARGITASRIKTVGNGTDRNEKNAVKARRADSSATITIKEDK